MWGNSRKKEIMWLPSSRCSRRGVALGSRSIKLGCGPGHWTSHHHVAHPSSQLVPSCQYYRLSNRAPIVLPSSLQSRYQTTRATYYCRLHRRGNRTRPDGCGVFCWRAESLSVEMTIDLTGSIWAVELTSLVGTVNPLKTPSPLPSSCCDGKSLERRRWDTQIGPEASNCNP